MPFLRKEFSKIFVELFTSTLVTFFTFLFHESIPTARVKNCYEILYSLPTTSLKKCCSEESAFNYFEISCNAWSDIGPRDECAEGKVFKKSNLNFDIWKKF